MEEELREREATLVAREQELARREQLLNKSAPNWPSFYPIVRQDIEGDIPQDNQPVVRKVLQYWTATVVLVFFNFLTELIILFSGQQTLPADVGISFVYAFIISIGSFYLWNRPCYLALKSQSSLYSFVFLIFYGWHILFCCYMAIGIPGSGAAGFISLIALFVSGSIVAALFSCVACAGWVGSFLYGMYLWKLVYNDNRSSGHTLASARNEAVYMGGTSYLRSESGQFV